MTVSMSTVAIDTFVPMLRTLSTLLDKGAEHARAKGFDPAVLVGARLAPDMYPLARQVQIACDSARRGVARLIGQEPTPVPDTEQSIDELKARIAATIDYLTGIPASAFDGTAERRIVLPLMEDRVLDIDGFGFLRDWMLPNFYFHVVTAYDILRHNGVDIGKRDFLGAAGPHIRRK